MKVQYKLLTNFLTQSIFIETKFLTFILPKDTRISAIVKSLLLLLFGGSKATLITQIHMQILLLFSLS